MEGDSFKCNKISQTKSNCNIISQSNHHFLSRIEIDTIRMCLDIRKVTDKQSKNLLYLFNAHKVNSYMYVGKYKGFGIQMNDFSITITGSPSNYDKGKTKTLPYFQFERAVEKLSKELGVNLHRARIFRVDINWNYITQLPVASYTHNLFVDLSRFKRVERGLGVLFTTKSKAIDIYNKSLELKDKKIVNSLENWLRIEFRILKNVKKLLRIEYVEDLYNPENYKKLLLEFSKYYHNIKKQTQPIDDISKLKSVKEYKKLMNLRGIMSKGGFSSAYREIYQIDKMGVFANPNQKYRLRQELKNLAENPSINSPHPSITELNTQFDFDLNYELNRLK